MAVPIRVPTFGLTEGEATVVEWLKSVGDTVVADEVLFIAENEKATLEVPSPSDGSLLAVLAAPGESVPLKGVVGWIGRPGEAVPGTDSASQRAQADREGPAPGHPMPVTGEWVKATPIARRMARHHNIDLALVRGTGPGGRVKLGDVEAALAAAQAGRRASASDPGGSTPSELQALTAIRRRTADRMTESFTTAPHFYLQIDVLATRLVELRAEVQAAVEERTGVRLSFTDLLLSALSRTLPRHPLLNAAWEDGQVRVFNEVHLCVAAAGPDGLVAPVIHRADSLSLEQVASERHTLVEKARVGRLNPQDLRGGTFTLTNLGMYGIDAFIPVLNPPQSAILAAGAIRQRPVCDGSGAVLSRPTLPLTLSADHRVVDGAQAAMFLRDLKELIEAPAQLLLGPPQ
jgi:pyruvate dehydrogenase E2 component (dihydrolipoamide acetyltransferase)